MRKQFNLFGIVLVLAIVVMIAGCGDKQKNPVGATDVEKIEPATAKISSEEAPVSETTSETIPTPSEGQAGTTLIDASVTGNPHWTITYGWTIDKSVMPETWNLFRGDDGTSQYAVSVTKDAGTVRAWIDGEVCVTNGGAVATVDLAIEIKLRDGHGQNATVIATASVDLSSNPILDPGNPGETGCYSYSIDVPSEYITAGRELRIDADITITNHSGHLGVPFGPSPSTDPQPDLPSSATLINDIIHVTDTNVDGDPWEFNSSDDVSYTKNFTCADAGKNDNTATITETGQSDDASVTVTCYELDVTKTAKTYFTRTYDWTIDKEADKSSLTLAVGESPVQVNYTVAVSATYTDNEWSVDGTITISNPNPDRDAVLTGVSDEISGGIEAEVSCGSLTVPAGGSIECTYSASLPDGFDRTNTATATLQNYSYNYDGSVETSGTTDFSGSKDVIFGAPTTEVDKCINPSDTYAGSLGEVCYDDAPKTFTYSRWIGPYDVCGDYTVDNTASFVTPDLEITGSDAWTVSVSVPCAGGCTLTQGYWKTHSSHGPAPEDPTWGGMEDSDFFSSGQSYYEVLWTPPAGNVYYNLAHQYIAAELNKMKGADFSDAQSAFDAATILFNTYTPAQVAGLKGKAKTEWTNLASILDSYNNGYIGPGHCDE